MLESYPLSLYICENIVIIICIFIVTVIHHFILCKDCNYYHFIFVGSYHFIVTIINHFTLYGSYYISISHIFYVGIMVIINCYYYHYHFMFFS